MNTTLLTKTVTGERPKPSIKRPAPKPARNTRWYVAIVVGLVILAAAVWAAAAIGDNDAEEVTGPAMELSLGDDSLLASCLPVDATTLSGMSPAFAATATAIESGKVTLAVDRWYAGGGDASSVELSAQPGQAALIAGFDFEVGEQYLITAANGNVNFCGYSGPATPELTNLFNQAFPG